jgi:hypothetical protein
MANTRCRDEHASYAEWAQLYELIYHWKDYAPGEAEKVRERLV